MCASADLPALTQQRATLLDSILHGACVGKDRNSVKLTKSQIVSRFVCTNTDCRLQQARMWSEWKELQARKGLTSHTVLLLAHAAHPQLQLEPHYSCITLLFSPTAPVAELFMEKTGTKAPQQFTNSSPLVSLTVYLRSETRTTNRAQVFSLKL